MAASTPTLASDETGDTGSAAAPPRNGVGVAGPELSASAERLREGSAGLAATRMGLVGFSVVAVVVFALYAAYMASKVEDVIAPVEIVVPANGAASPLGLGQVAPDFTFKDMEGGDVRLSDFKGRPVCVNV